MPTPDHFPPVGFHFRVSFGFLASEPNEMRFQEVTGLAAEVNTEEVVEGGENRFVHRLPVRAKYANLVLKRGLLLNSKLHRWIVNAVENLEAEPESPGLEPTTVYITLLDGQHQPLGDTYSFIKAWPVKWTHSDLKAMENSIVIETLELTYNYFTRVRL